MYVWIVVSIWIVTTGRIDYCFGLYTMLECRIVGLIGFNANYSHDLVGQPPTPTRYNQGSLVIVDNGGTTFMIAYLCTPVGMVLRNELITFYENSVYACSMLVGRLPGGPPHGWRVLIVVSSDGVFPIAPPAVSTECPIKICS